ncbi:SprT-like family-domain-containing protein, partial [Bombardia bombarda]
PPSHIPQHQQPGLVSPKKLPRIPNTPHRASSDAFWSREFIDDWNDEHSPKKILFPDATKSKTTTAKKTTSSSKPPSTTTTTSKPPSKTALAASAREAKKSFAAAKHALAESFLAELDETITAGQLSALAASTGGIKLNWTNKLNTTAGRANWKRETVRTKAAADPTSSASVTTTTKHHASIELAEKVIDDEHRLLNVIAHEFCHLANFMISGVTTNPHGKEFKVWAARCSRAFGESRGIEVTTKHSYDIDFKYAWTCVDCGMEFKRHSRSIDPKRHRCGACKSELRQTKPVPRVAKDGGKQGPSEYQVFMKEQMAVVRGENPGSPQKEIMRLVAGRW